MNTQAWAREMALYNKWQNEALYGHCAALSDEDRTADRGMFMGSILNTLDHILIVDMALLNYFAHGQSPAGFDPDKRVHETWDALAKARTAFDDDLLALIDSQAPDWLDETIPYARPGWDHVAEVPRQVFAMQMFNHGTHHRSQVTSELHKMGVDYGITDLPYNPLSQFWK